MSGIGQSGKGKGPWVLSLAILVTLLVIACGTAAPPEPVQPADTSAAESQPAPEVAQPVPLSIDPTAAPESVQPTAAPEPTAAPA